LESWRVGKLESWRVEEGNQSGHWEKLAIYSLAAQASLGAEIRNPKHKIPNKFKIPILKFKIKNK
jgi:hypothetical protein